MVSIECFSTGGFFRRVDMPSKASQITDPHSGEVVYTLQVLEGSAWRLFPVLDGNQSDISNPITSLLDIPNEQIRQTVELEIGRHRANQNAS